MVVEIRFDLCRFFTYQQNIGEGDFFSTWF